MRSPRESSDRAAEAVVFEPVRVPLDVPDALSSMLDVSLALLGDVCEPALLADSELSVGLLYPLLAVEFPEAGSEELEFIDSSGALGGWSLPPQ
jgi:hypothetical protein